MGSFKEDFAFAFGYLKEDEHSEFCRRSEEIGRMLNHIIDNPGRYGSSMRRIVACLQKLFTPPPIIERKNIKGLLL